ncbi:PREDICTED: RNA polymerase II-associated protein 3-like [Branchiostoma belcheri]|uniref:RNA polymerase II-associated protein 3 n=1 Tax=Branchiostoma belcheri TaxID=7741 RepID=A0A6P4ZLR4_BRABE|nr:PREDICTED: RNA polymerase II-associated protein 3-like [Branchiostoma belcheri]
MASPDKALEIQMQVRQNASEMQDFLKDLDDWEDDIKKKDEQLKTQQGGHEPVLPPIRNRATAKKKKKKVKTEEKKEETGPGQQNGQQKKKRISGYDYRSWDKFDVDKELEKLEDEQKESSSEYESESDGEKALEQQRLLQQALMEKDRGNAFFKEGKYDEAMSCYTTGMDADPQNAVLPANRAMALLKLNRYEDAIRDCTLAIDLDPTYTKAYHRRATARMELNKLEDAKRDFEKVLSLEPSNKQAQTELRRIKKALEPATKLSEEAVETKKPKPQPKDLPHVVRPISKPVHLRSKKPLRRLEIEEIGGGEDRKMFQLSTNLQATEPPSFSSEETSQRPAENFEKLQTGGEEKTARENLIQEVNDSPNTGVQQVNVNRTSNVERKKPTSPRGQPPVVTSDPPAVPGTPVTSLQLQADWRRLHGHPQLLYQYFKQIPPSMYVKLFQQSLESDILNGIMALLRDFYLPNKDDVYSVLSSLSEVKRFNMAIMFMSVKDKQVVFEVFKGLKLLGHQSQQDIDALCKKYEVNL